VPRGEELRKVPNRDDPTLGQGYEAEPALVQPATNATRRDATDLGNFCLRVMKLGLCCALLGRHGLLLSIWK